MRKHMSRQVAGKRLNKTDFYATPPWCYENLDIDWSIFEMLMNPVEEMVEYNSF